MNINYNVYNKLFLGTGKLLNIFSTMLYKWQLNQRELKKGL